MKGLATLTLAAVALGAAVSASADMAVGHPGHQPCHYYLHRNLAAPKRCFPYYQDAVGPGVFTHGDFVFRSREAFLHSRGSTRGEERLASTDHDEDRYGGRDQMASHEAPPPPPQDREGVSGGAARGTGAYQGESGGALRGAKVRDNRSGGASGY